MRYFSNKGLKDTFSNKGLKDTFPIKGLKDTFPKLSLFFILAPRKLILKIGICVELRIFKLFYLFIYFHFLELVLRNSI